MKANLTLSLMLLFLIAFGIVGQAQWIQVGEDIDGKSAIHYSGTAVSLSSDGTIVAIGAPGNGPIPGYVSIYENIEDNWTQVGQDIQGEAVGDYFGASVSLSSDGSVVAIGAPENDGNGDSSGHVRVFQNTGGTWNQIGQDIDGEDSGDISGISVSLNYDGSALAIGAMLNDGNGFNSGHVRIFQNSAGSWIQVGQDIDGEEEGDRFGLSVSLSSDGSIVAIGAPRNDQNGIDSGHASVFEYISGSWTQIGSDIYGEATDDRFGNSVRLSSDGYIVAIGAPNNDDNGSDSGHVRVYENIGGAWTKIGQDIDGEALGDRSGFAISLSSNGSVVAIGAPGNDGNGIQSGHVRVYQYIGGAWTQVGQDIDGEDMSDNSGHALCLSSDDSFVAIGAYFNDDNGPASGHVRVFYNPTLGIEDISQIKFSVYPSPTSGIVNIELETTITQIAVYNILGQLVKSNTGQYTIDISNAGQGFYIVQVMDEFGNISFKKIVKK